MRTGLASGAQTRDAVRPESRVQRRRVGVQIYHVGLCESRHDGTHGLCGISRSGTRLKPVQLMEEVAGEPTWQRRSRQVHAALQAGPMTSRAELSSTTTTRAGQDAPTLDPALRDIGDIGGVGIAVLETLNVGGDLDDAQAEWHGAPWTRDEDIARDKGRDLRDFGHGRFRER